MATLQDLNTEQAELQAKIALIEANKQAAIEQDRNEKLALITVYENEAIGYRNQAAKATDQDKRKLYGFANDSEKLAIELKQELGINTENEQNYQSAQIGQTKALTYRAVNALLLKALFALFLYVIADYVGGAVNGGIFAYVLNTLAKILFFVSGAFGGSWLVCSILLAYFSDYVTSELLTDYQNLTPFQKLIILVSLAFALLNFFSKFSPNGI